MSRQHTVLLIKSLMTIKVGTTLPTMCSCFHMWSSKQAHYRKRGRKAQCIYEDELDSESVCTLGEPASPSKTSEIFGGSVTPGFQQRSHAALYSTSLKSQTGWATLEVYLHPPRRRNRRTPDLSDRLIQ